jgi:predicted transcriptional regulator
MYPERTNTCTTITQLKIPHGTIAALAGISASKVSEYAKQLDVSGRASSRIEKVVNEIADLVSVMQQLVGMKPDLRDVPTLRATIQELHDARRLIEAQSQLAQAERQVATALQEFATQ